MFMYAEKYSLNKIISSNLDCTLTVHRRCVSKVGNYCGCEENVLALYEQWKESVCIDPRDDNDEQFSSLILACL